MLERPFRQKIPPNQQDYIGFTGKIQPAALATKQRTLD
jgi:hypothetical protein